MTIDSQVLVVGVGPVGLMLAAELEIAAIHAVLVEQLAEPVGGSLEMPEGDAVCRALAAVGANVTEMAAGNQVYGLVRFLPFDGRGHGRTHAEYVNAPVADLAPKPYQLSHIEAAAVPMAVLTAWQPTRRCGAA
ncbi:FAD-dependent monooxygenase [Nocardia jiangxiensis]|uniref:FAD-dependent monooxygenase n=1 Tax=Nocardia jiangxiensis TaxID=282685 RepID=A0ABW6SBU6_9NOCA